MARLMPSRTPDDFLDIGEMKTDISHKIPELGFKFQTLDEVQQFFGSE